MDKPTGLIADATQGPTLVDTGLPRQAVAVAAALADYTSARSGGATP
ncbi:MAG: hypothetical protein HGA45_25930 [Chloroflexales bacterium]|nr:hypothetical protein [Chloroflexales bacterium]